MTKPFRLFLNALPTDAERNALVVAVQLPRVEPEKQYAEIVRRYERFYDAYRANYPDEPEANSAHAVELWIREAHQRVALLKDKPGVKIQGDPLTFIGPQLAGEVREHFKEAVTDKHKDTLSDNELRAAVYDLLAAKLAAVSPRDPNAHKTSPFAPLYLPDAAKKLSLELLQVRHKGVVPEDKNTEPAPEQTVPPKEEVFASVTEVIAYMKDNFKGTEAERDAMVRLMQEFVQDLPIAERRKLNRMPRDDLKQAADHLAQQFSQAEDPQDLQQAANGFLYGLMEESRMDPRAAPTQERVNKNMQAAGIMAVGLTAVGSMLQSSGSHTQRLTAEREAKAEGRPEAKKGTNWGKVALTTLGVTASFTGIALAVSAYRGGSFSRQTGANLTHLYRQVSDSFSRAR